MKKIKKFLVGNIKTVVAFVLGLIISGTGVYAATILFASNQVGYDNTSSGLTSTNVQDALDELYTKANTWIDPSSLDFQFDTTQKIVATRFGVCIYRNNKLNCFKINNWAEEQNHIQQVFSDISCNVYSSRVACDASDFYCEVESSGRVRCLDYPDYKDCVVYPYGSIDCT